jgi:hypothetical protein
VTGVLRDKRSRLWERDPYDWYVEPERATEQLLSVERFIGDVWDPACGQGNIIRTLRDASYRAFGSDVVRRAEESWFIGEHDFLSDAKPPLGFENIVTNPPFFRAKGAEAFIRKALAITPGKVCVFVDIRFLAGDGRANGLYAEHKPSRCWIVTPRVSCPPGEHLAAGGKAEGGSADWVWLVWDRTAPSGTMATDWLTAEAKEQSA